MDIRQALLSLMGQNGASANAFADEVGWDVRNGANALTDQFMGRRSIRKYAGENGYGAPAPAPAPAPSVPRVRVGEAPPSYPVGPGYFAQNLAPVDQAVWRQQETPQIGDRVTPLAVGSEAPERGLEPATANRPQTQDTAFTDALHRARQQIAQEGYPYMTSPSWVRSRINMDRAVEVNRADRSEQARREGVSWQDWWHWGGRQGGEADASQPAYRFGRAPPRNSR